MAITVDNVNEAPIAIATADPETVSEGEIATLDASSSFDPEGDNLFFSWSQTAGPNAELISSDEPTVQVLTPATTETVLLTFQLTVTDSVGNNTSATLDITVEDITPQLLAIDDTVSAQEDDTSVDFDVLANDSLPATVTVSRLNGTDYALSDGLANGDSGGVFYIDNNGIGFFDPEYDFVSLEDGESITTTVTYTITDSIDSSTATLAATVFGISGYTTVEVDGFGNTDSPYTFDAGQGPFKFVDTENQSNNISIIKFGLDDQIELGTELGNVLVFDNETDTTIEFTSGGSNRITLVGVTVGAEDVATFNADPNYGDIVGAI